MKRPPWHEAAALAPFTFYETDEYEQRWAGGFSADGSAIEVLTTIDGVDVAVSTSRSNDGLPEGREQRAVATDLVWHRMMSDTTELALPLAITIEADDRLVTIGSTEHSARGMRLTGEQRWVGVVRIDDITVKITTSSTAALTLSPCVDATSVPELRAGPS